MKATFTKTMQTASLLLLVFIVPLSAAYPPEWGDPPVPPGGFEFNMNIVASIQNPDASIADNAGNVIAGYVGEEFRGAIAAGDSDATLFFLTIVSDLQSGETITFKAYLADLDIVVDFNETIQFQNGAFIGENGDPFMGNPFIFTYTMHSLLLTANPEDGGVLTGDGDYQEGAVVPITATPNPGYLFQNWTGDDVALVDDATAAETTVTMPADDVNLTANFSMIDYTLNVNVSPEQTATIVANPSQDNYNLGDEIELTVFPEVGWEFDDWTGDTDGLSAPEVLPDRVIFTLTMPAANVEITANMQQKEYSLTLNADPEAGGTLTGAGDDYNLGQVVNIEAIANPGYEFVNWTGDVGVVADENSAATTVTMPADDVELTANFEIVGYELTLISNPAGGGVLTGGGVYVLDDVVTVEATANPGYVFNNWTDGDGVIISAAASFAYTMPADDVELTANFSMIDYTLTVNIDPVDSGTVDIDPDLANYNVGDEVELTANPEEGWEFVNWTGDIDGLLDADAAETTLTMPADDVELTANFQMIDYMLTVEVEPAGAGTVDIDPDQAEYNFEDVITLTANPEDGWEFVNWTGDVEGLDDEDAAEATLTMPADDVNLTANFEMIDYSLTLVANPVEGGTVSGAGDDYNVGQVVNIQATANPGWQFDNWTGDVAHVADANLAATTVTMPADNVDLTANFSMINYTLTLNVNQADGGEVTGAGTEYNAGDEVDITAIPNAGWTFSGWTGDDIVHVDDPSAAATKVSMPIGDVTLTAFFIAPVYNENTDTYYADIQDAVDQAAPGDKIQFAGTHESLDATGTGVTLAPGSSAGCVTFNGDYTLDATVTLEIDLEGLTPCSEHDQVIVQGDATLGGANLELILAFLPDLLDEFVIITSDNPIIGEFAQDDEIQLIYDEDVITFSISYDGNEVTLTVTNIESAVPVPLSGWSFLLIFGLFATFMAFRFYRP